MSRLVKFFWFLSMLIFLVALLYVYAYLPAMVGVHAGPQGYADQFVEKSNFFYMSIAVFLLANIAFYILRVLLYKTWVNNRADSAASGQVGLRTEVADWLLGFAAALNIFFVFILAYLAIFNNTENMDHGMYTPLVYGGPVLMAILFIILIYIFLKKRRA